MSFVRNGLFASSLLASSLTLGLAACGGSTQPAVEHPTPVTSESGAQVTVERVEVPKQPPPESAPAGDIHFPKIERRTTASGLEINSVQLSGLPVLQVKLVIRSGSAADPSDLHGSAQLVAQMLREGTTKKTSAKIAETVDFLGAHLGIHSNEEQVVIDMKALSDQLPEALGLVAELAMQPTFDDRELKKLKKRELDRLSLVSQSPSFLARREFWKALYGEHPYAHVDTTKDVVKRIKRSDLPMSWHRRYFAPNNAYLVVVGDVAPDAVASAAERAFKGWKKRDVPDVQYPATPSRNAREIILVDRPESVQSVIYVGNLGLARKSPDYVPLSVANQVLGGSAASRMFMDLREKQSLTYGAYSDVEEMLEPGPFRAFAAVRNEVTAQALAAFMAHLERIVSEEVPESELNDAKRFLVDSFPLRIETSGEIAGHVSQLRTFGFPDDYWDGYRAEIQRVGVSQALDAAKKYITPDRALIVVVGRAAAVKEALSAYGPVKVIDTEGKLLVDPASTKAAPAEPAPATAQQPATKE